MMTASKGAFDASTFAAQTATTPVDGRDEAIAAARNLAARWINDRDQVRSLIGYIDLTTLAGDDTRARVQALVDKALRPLPADPEARCGAVCVYPARVKDVAGHLRSQGDTGNLGIAAVAGGFPSGQYLQKSKLVEIEGAVADGATEIDTVISRWLALEGEWQQLSTELAEQKAATTPAHLKVILATGELGTDENIHKASWAALLAGADFIKTSTGKEAVNATLPVAFVMLRAIRAYHELTGRRVGFKPAGGIRTVAEALEFLALVQIVLGDAWLTPKLFRIGASSLLDNVVAAL